MVVIMDHREGNEEGTGHSRARIGGVADPVVELAHVRFNPKSRARARARARVRARVRAKINCNAKI